MTVNFKNLSENLIIAVVTAITASVLTYFAVSLTASEIGQITIQGLTPVLQEAVKKETNAIKNDIKVEVAKIKNSDSLNININQLPKNKLSSVIEKDSLLPEGYLLVKKSLFSDMKGYLSRRQKRKLNLD